MGDDSIDREWATKIFIRLGQALTLYPFRINKKDLLTWGAVMGLCPERGDQVLDYAKKIHKHLTKYLCTNGLERAILRAKVATR